MTLIEIDNEVLKIKHDILLTLLIYIIFELDFRLILDLCIYFWFYKLILNIMECCKKTRCFVKPYYLKIKFWKYFRKYCQITEKYGKILNST